MTRKNAVFVLSICLTHSLYPMFCNALRGVKSALAGNAQQLAVSKAMMKQVLPAPRLFLQPSFMSSQVRCFADKQNCEESDDGNNLKTMFKSDRNLAAQYTKVFKENFVHYINGHGYHGIDGFKDLIHADPKVVDEFVGLIRQTFRYLAVLDITREVIKVRPDVVDAFMEPAKGLFGALIDDAYDFVDDDNEYSYEYEYEEEGAESDDVDNNYILLSDMIEVRPDVVDAFAPLAKKNLAVLAKYPDGKIVLKRMIKAKPSLARDFLDEVSDKELSEISEDFVAFVKKTAKTGHIG